MGLWRNLALINLTNPNALSQDVKNALQAKWEYEVTHPKKKSGITKVVKSVTGAIGDAIHAVGKTAGNLGQSSINVFKEAASGNIGKAVGNAVNVATLGTTDVTGNNRGGFANISGTKYLNALTGGAAGASMSTSSAMSSYTSTNGNKKAKGLLTQLRKGKGSAGGGSYTEAVKNPLGGSAGKTGK